MKVEQFEELISAIENIGSTDWLFIFIASFVVGFAAFIGIYLRKKGDNLATKEDIGRITDTIEGIRTYYAKELEDIKSVQSLKLAAIDKRLEAHQKAYSLWIKLVRDTHQEEKINQTVMDCQEWWDANCLYLTSRARIAFKHATICAFDHVGYLRARDVNLVKQNWADIKRTGELILQGDSLPSFGDHELDHIKRNKDGNYEKMKPEESF